ncbi:MAG: class I SAM-dependent methyltransferase [bacterium]|jgi:SAM-dependent methyltransferase|nr:class I SAM-dependent methyltransferase [bacterium]
MNKYWNWFHLNWRVLHLALRGRWLNQADIASGYDSAAPSYDEAWLVHLSSVTDRLLQRLPPIPSGPILDLGCGTGYTTAFLAQHYPHHPLTAVDLSPAMIAKARERLAHAEPLFFTRDMLKFLQREPPAATAMVLSAWAIGYSYPNHILRQAGRVLKEGGCFAFVVNRLDTLGPIFKTFQEGMLRFPRQVNRALWPHFPKSWGEMQGQARQAGLIEEFVEEDKIPLTLPSGTPPLDWVLGTGILAGFDAVLPLRSPGPVADFFNERLETMQDELAHHYIMAILRKRGAS